ncbi:MAG: GNAT family N-acetyltransferase [Anaerolineaceae bacterium]|nr:GNAT family N-acetyltransferase [Anaerolineaceae bacterium]
MQLQRIQSNAPIAEKRRFDELIASVFGFTFEPWYSRGWWTPDYTVYTLAEDDRLLASTAAYRMEMLIDGQRQTWLQIGAVATRPECRGQGLSRRLMQTILEDYPNTPMFLCANASVLDFYPRFGFQRIHDRVPTLRCSPQGSAAPLQPLGPDDPHVREMLSRRACFSSTLDCLNAASVQAFHLLTEYPQCIYAVPGADALVVAEQDGATLRLLDVCAAEPLSFAQLLPCLHFPGIDTIQFGFNPDWLGIECEWVASQDEDGLFARGKFQLEPNFILPALLKT